MYIWLIINDWFLFTAFAHINADIYGEPGHLYNYDRVPGAMPEDNV